MTFKGAKPTEPPRTGPSPSAGRHSSRRGTSRALPKLRVCRFEVIYIYICVFIYIYIHTYMFICPHMF